MRATVQAARRVSFRVGPGVLAGAAALVMLGAGCAAPGRAPDPGYTAERRSEFLEACSREADPEACRCVWDRIVAQVPTERFVEVSEAVAAGEPLPSDLAAVAADCATDVVLDR